jgi:hypothetical protein
VPTISPRYLSQPDTLIFEIIDNQIVVLIDRTATGQRQENDRIATRQRQDSDRTAIGQQQDSDRIATGQRQEDSTAIGQQQDSRNHGCDLHSLH